MENIRENPQGRFIRHLFQGEYDQALLILEDQISKSPSPATIGMLRLAAQAPNQNYLNYIKLYNYWRNLDNPPLKPNAVCRNLVIVSDITADSLICLTELFSACYGVQLEIQVAPFDSVEQLAFDRNSVVEFESSTIVLLILSEHWLKKYLGSSALVENQALEQLRDTYNSIINGLLDKKPAHLLVSNHPALSFPSISTALCLEESKGWNVVLAEINGWLYHQQNTRLSIVDISEALFGSYGRHALGKISYLRAKMYFEPAGTITAAREIAAAVANICGKTHRALVTDWDNTLWGGVVGEVGVDKVVSGPESPDGLGYYLLQQYIKGLKSIGVLLAAASKNDPKLLVWLNEKNDGLALKADDFDSSCVNWNPKSMSISQISKELGFGPEYMVFLDDSLFELTEVFLSHPYIDIIQAAQQPEKTLNTLNDYRYFTYVNLSASDLTRSKTAEALKRQREYKATFTSLEEFLANIKINLDIAELSDANIGRITQMFQKTNQFNLTTRRHSEGKLKEMQASGTRIFAVSYSDTFGSQGIISVVVTEVGEDTVYLESWLMSCRVLNRTVEYALFRWLASIFPGKTFIGEYIPSEKNGMVRDFYQKLGFELIKTDKNTGAEIWHTEPGTNPGKVPADFAKINAQLRSV